MRYSTLIILLFITSCTFLRTFAADVKVSTKWLDDEQQPLAGIDITYGFDGDSVRHSTTDAGGLCVMKGPSYCREVSYCARPQGYYYTEGHYKLPILTNVISLTSDSVITAVVRKVVDPIPMFAKKVDTQIPRPNEWYGFDLLIGDWVAPSGRGTYTDLLFRVTGYWNSYRDYDSTLHLQWKGSSNGFIGVVYDTDHTRPTGSALFMPRTAPPNGYTPSCDWHKSRHMTVDTRTRDAIHDDFTLGKGYVFQTRGVAGLDGIATNTLYGKIPFDIMFGGASTQGCFLKFTYYLNPTPNDRNLEFDPKRNLFKDLKPNEHVETP